MKNRGLQSAAHRASPVPDPELRRALLPARRQLARQRLINALTTAVVTASGAVSVTLLIARTRPVADLGLWCLGLAVAVTTGGVVYGLAAKPGWSRVAAAVDAAGLSERVVTALYQDGAVGMDARDGEPGDLAHAFARVQRRDTLERLATFQPKQALPVRWPVKAWRGLAIGLVAVVALAVWPNPMAAVAERDRAIREAAVEQAKAVEAVRRDLTKTPVLDPKTAAEVDKTLEELVKELKRAKSAEDALKALAKAQDKLGQTASTEASEGLQTGAGQTLSELADEMTGTKAGQSAGEKIAAGDSQAAKSEIDKLAASTKDLSTADRNELASALDRAAGSPAGGTLAQAAARASRALNGSDAAATDQAMAGLGSAVAAAMQSAAGSQALAQAQSALQGAQSAMAQAGQGSQVAGGGQGQSGQGSQGQSGSGTGTGQGTSGQGQSGSGTGTGQGTSGQGQSGSGGGSSGAGSGSSNTDSGSGSQAPDQPGQTNQANPSVNKVGEYERLYDPTRLGGDGQTSVVGGKMGQGDSEYSDTSQTSLGSGGLVPYDEVYGAYSSEAMTAIDNGYLPGSLKDLIRRYFGSLDPAGGN